jgi:predicted dienelactone hydrolase
LRPLEIVLALTLALRVLATLLPGRAGATWRTLLAMGVGGAMVAQLLVEGPRWQLLPLDLLAGGLLIRALFAGEPARRRALRFAGGGVALVAASALALLFPVPNPPAPTGSLAVGSLSFEIDDPTRIERFGARAGELRRVVVRLWYPSDGSEGLAPAPWSEDVERIADAMARYGGLPNWMFDHLPLVESNAAWAPPLSAERDTYPVVFFEHGRAGWRAINSFLTEDLASHGYVVVAVEHPYTALVTVFADGEVAPFLEDALPAGDDPAEVAASQATVQQWGEDVRFVADALRIGLVPQLAGRLELDRVGVAGHSTGGASALDLCASWQRCAAAVGLDAWVVLVSDGAVATGSDTPTLLLQSDPAQEVFTPANDARLAEIVAGVRAEVQHLELIGSGHHDFDDTGLLSPAAPLFGYSKGPIRIGRAFAIVRGVTRGFFDRHLRGREVLDPAARYPEVRVVEGRTGE